MMIRFEEKLSQGYWEAEAIAAQLAHWLEITFA
jgi:hypothetical protein